MAVLRTSWSLCLNDHVVPVQTKNCSIVDLYELTEGLDLDLEDTEMSLVRFGGTPDMSWLMKSLGMPVKWWIHNWNRIPLILEIRELIKAKKNPDQVNQRIPFPVKLDDPVCQTFLLKLMQVFFGGRIATLDQLFKSI